MRFARNTALVLALCTHNLPHTAEAYPIDCAILLCLPGGFPSSAECTAAKIEMIRRITPFPIEPPLQLWNCPMKSPAGLVLPGMDADGLTPEVRQYRSGIELYQIDYRQTRGGGDTNVLDRSKFGFYDDDGEFIWQATSMRDAPAWVFDATNVDESTVRNQVGTIMRWRGVLMRYHDYQGSPTTEWVTY